MCQYIFKVTHIAVDAHIVAHIFKVTHIAVDAHIVVVVRRCGLVGRIIVVAHAAMVIRGTSLSYTKHHS